MRLLVSNRRESFLLEPLKEQPCPGPTQQDRCTGDLRRGGVFGTECREDPSHTRKVQALRNQRVSRQLLKGHLQLGAFFENT